MRGRALVVKRASPAAHQGGRRSYVIGSGWKDYQDTGAICGIAPCRRPEAGAEAAPIFTPAKGRRVGDHDETSQLPTGPGPPTADSVLAGPSRGTGKTGAQLVAEARDPPSRCIPRRRLRRHRGIIIADTKFEFGIDAAGTLHLIDEP